MSNPTPRRLNSLFAASGRKQRRPAGISRRRKKQLGFETLEDRRVMTADSPFDDGGMQTGSFSSATPEGQWEILLREMYWQSLIASSTGASAPNGSSYTQSVPTDPLVGSQWHLINSGQQVGNPDFQAIFGVAGEDINVAGAWNLGYTGQGVTVAVIDTGVQLSHPDLAANINLLLAFDAVNPSGTGNPDFNNPGNAHGTAVAGLIGAIANNGIGGAGVAPGVTLVPIQLIGNAALTNNDVVEALRHAIQDIDITNNSWGSNVPRDISAFLAAPTPAQLLALRDSVIFGRGGKGVIHVFASGNSAGTPWGAPGFQDVGGLDSAAYNGWVNSRYTIGVTGVDHDGFYNNFDGTHTGYPEISSAVLVAAPTGSNVAQNLANDTGVGSGIWTTDLTGDFGYNVNPNPVTGEETDRDFLDNSVIPNAADYTSRFNGTSASAPIVSGVIALMLEANPNLSWRDVQEILVRSARQNAPLAVPQNGFQQGHQTDGTQNLWIINQTPVFHDPDPFILGSGVSAIRSIFFPTLDPNITSVGDDPTDPDFWTMHYQPTPITMTNGAGYTVSMGKGANGEAIGYGHGVVDAEMAVRLAEQWHTKNQALPNELTFTSFVAIGGGFQFPQDGLIPAAEIGSDDIANILVPGGLGGQAGFISFWNEYATDTPFAADNGPENRRGAPLFFTVPDNNTMSIESVEVKISISGGTAAAMDHLRILLVSPDGTHSELNDYSVQPQGTISLQNGSPATFRLAGQSADNGGDFVWTFSTKRSWGERSDNALVFDPVTGLPIINTTGFSPLTGEYPPGFTIDSIGTALQQGWQLHFENYGPVPFNLNAVEMVWHGSPIAANSQRVQGFVGVDDNRDDLFNYSRVITSVFNLAGDDPNVLRYSEVQAEVDLNQESFAGNVTVTVRRASDNVVVDQFITGHDGNFYFDLVPDDYIISIEDPQGRVAQDDTITGSGFLDKYKSEWRITPEHFRVWSMVDTNADGIADSTPVDANGLPVAWLDGTGNTQVYGMKGINFLLDPGDAPANQVEFTGTIYADMNGDGVYNGNDINMPGITVFADVNRNGVRDAGEATAITAANGQYTLVVPVTSAAIMNVGVVRPTNWTSTNDTHFSTDSPTDGLESFFVQPGAEFAGVNFAIRPGASGAGGGGANQPGVIIGTVFEDANGNGVRDVTEKGAPQFTVYIDANNNGVLDFGDTSTVTNEHGAYVFTNVAPGARVVRMVATGPNVQTAPTNNGARIVQLVGSSTVHVGTEFGVRNTATYDWGDLPDSYGITTGPNAARHLKGSYYLGQRVDGDGDATTGGMPSIDAKGDDNSGMPDEDGVDFGAGFTAGSTAQIIVNASRANGKLQLWIDWDNDGSFAEPGDRVLTNLLLLPGDNVINIDVPATAKPQVYARFRYGNADLGLGGIASIGEVEDYRIDVAQNVVVPADNGLPSDANQDGIVDGTDFLAWQRNVNRTSGATLAQGDANQDGSVNHLDLNEWKQSYGASVAAATGGSSSGSMAAMSGEQAFGPVELREIEPVIHQYFAPAAAVTTPIAATVDEPTIAAGELLSTSFGLFGRGPFVDLSARSEATRDAVAKAIDRIQDGLAGAEERVRMAADRVVERLETLDPDFLRRDRAFADLIGSRRKAFKAEAEFELAEEGDQADEAFAVFADHFEWRRG